MSRVLALTQLLTRLFSDEELRLHVAAEPSRSVAWCDERPRPPGCALVL